MTNLLDLDGQTGLTGTNADVVLNWKAEIGITVNGPAAPTQGLETRGLAASQATSDGIAGGQFPRPLVQLQASVSASLEAAKPGGPTALPAAASATGRTFDTGRSNAGLNFTPADPLYADQWHFDLMGNGGGRAFIETVWNEFTGAGVNVGVYDSGVQSIHHDLDDNYNSSLHVVVGGVTLPGDPDATLEAHGTAVAGIIGAEAENGAGGVGVAHGVNLTGVNIFDPTSPAFINAAFPTGFFEAMMQMTNFDVTNHSWGAYPGYFPSESVPGSFTQDTLATMQNAVENGRGGLGTNIVKAAGNDFTDSNGDGLNASRYTITVNALLENGFASAYSNSGSSSLVSAAGGDFQNPPFDGTRHVTTTDLLGTDGYNTFADPTGAQDFTDRMNGTSAATPMVAGVIALMLEANPNLGWRDVQNILAMTAFQTGSGLGAAVPGQNEEHFWFENGAGNWNGGGMHFSNDYGYGNIDPFGAVRMAEALALINQSIGQGPRTSSNEMSSSTGSIPVNLAPADGQPASFVSATFNFGSNLVIEHVQLVLTISHTWIGDLIINLTSAEGTVVNVKAADINSSSTFSGGATWAFGIDALRGEVSAGDWTLSVSDAFGADIGAVTGIDMTVFGDLPDPDDVFHFTDEFMGLALGDPSRTLVNDTDGGIDWINASAMSSNVFIDLRNGTTSLVEIGATANIENAITGDGDDTLIGNGLNNELHGMRGSDTFRGGGGADILKGGTGRDTADYSISAAAVTVSLVAGVVGIGGHAHGDTLFSIENVIGSNHNDTLTGSNGINDLFGGIGFDTLIGGRGADNLFGGDDFDFADYSASLKKVFVSLFTNLGTGGDAKGDVLDGIEGLVGSAIGDSLVGDNGDNTLLGGGGADILAGRGGIDTLDGGSGNDRIIGGQGADLLTGNTGKDTFAYNTKNEAGDTIFDFNNVLGDNDSFEFAGATFGGLAAGNLAVNQFQKSTSDTALTTDVRFFYETDTNTLWFDQDGLGGVAAIAVAFLQPGADVIRGDILIV